MNREEDSESEVGEVGKNKRRNQGRQRKEAKDDSDKVKPKVGVATFLGRERNAGKK